jgi:hypothetical protein
MTLTPRGCMVKLGVGCSRNTPHTEHIVHAAALRTSNLLRRHDNTLHCYKPRSYTPEYGQKIARNMLS